MHEELWQQLIVLDGHKTSQRAKCQYLLNPERYVLTLLNTEYVVNLSDRHIFAVRDCSELKSAEFLEQLCLLAYLINAMDLPLANKLVKAESLPGGEFFFRGPHLLPTQKLEQVFGTEFSLLYEAGMQLGAKRCNFGDASIELFVLGRIPLTFVIWAADSEFGARASILFDQTASEQLPLDALLAAVSLTVDTIICFVANSG